MDTKEEKTPDTLFRHNRLKLTRRSFIAASALAGTSAIAAGGIKAMAQIRIDPATKDRQEEKYYASICRLNCQSQCRMYTVVRNGRVVKTTMAPFTPEGTVQDPHDARFNTICLKGLSHVQRIYGTNRILYPMKQTKKRGDMSGFVRISWDQAIKEISAEIVKRYDPNGSKKFGIMSASGNYGHINGIFGGPGILNKILKGVNFPSGLDMALPVGLSTVCGLPTYPFITGNDLDDLLNAKTIMLWGSNTSEAHILAWGMIMDAKAMGTKLVNIDIMFTPTASKSDLFINIKSGTDTMLALAMMNVLFYEKPQLLDIPFIYENTAGPLLVREDTKKYLRGKDLPGGAADDMNYVAYNTRTKKFETTVPKDFDANLAMPAGKKAMLSDGNNYELENSQTITIEGKSVNATPAFALLKAHVKKNTPEMAQVYTGIAPDVTRRLVEQYAAPQNKPASIYFGFGLSQYNISHHNGHAIATLAALTGNCMKPGAGVGNYFRRSRMVPGHPRPTFTNPSMPAMHLRTAVAKEGYPLEMLYINNANPMNNFTNQTTWREDFWPKMKVIVTQDIEFTDSAIMSDYVLPAAHWFEVDDMFSGSKHPFLVLQDKAVEPQGEAIADIESFRLLIAEIEKSIPDLDASKYFMKDGKPKTGRDYVAACLNPNGNPKIPYTVEEFFQKKVMRNTRKEDRYIFGGEGYVPTNSGRLEWFTENPELYCRVISYGQTLTDAEKELEYLPSWEEPDEAYFGPTTRKAFEDLRKKYPLHLLTEHSRWRVHSQYSHIPWLREQDPEPTIKLNPADAKRYGDIKDGDYVRVTNDRGTCVAKAILTEGLPEGVVNMQKGWHNSHYTQEYGYGGNYQELTNPVYHKVGMGQAFYDVRVKIEKAKRG